VQSIKLPRIQHVWQTGSASRAIMIFTFIATLIVPIQYAVFLGVLLSFVMYIYRAADKVEIMEIVPLPGGRYEERPAPKQLPSHQVILLSPRGSLFFAGATEFEEHLPSVENAEQTVVLLRLRGREDLGSTFMRVLTRYDASLKSCRGKLVLVGVSETVYQQLEKTGFLAQLGKENIYRGTSFLGDSSMQAYEDATKWLGQETRRE
jgi:SulP family sulfate permease